MVRQSSSASRLTAGRLYRIVTSSRLPSHSTIVSTVGWADIVSRLRVARGLSERQPIEPHEFFPRQLVVKRPHIRKI
jgi:hypothetical protein